VIEEERTEAAVYYLRDSAQKYGALRGRMAYCEANLRRVKSLEMLGKNGSVAANEVAAYASEAYLHAMQDLENATAEYETMRAVREAAIYTIETWRSQNSTRKQGIV
jgi:hypothetical protein